MVNTIIRCCFISTFIGPSIISFDNPQSKANTHCSKIYYNKRPKFILYYIFYFPHKNKNIIPNFKKYIHSKKENFSSKDAIVEVLIIAPNFIYFHGRYFFNKNKIMGKIMK